jgi:hypothetical protein
MPDRKLEYFYDWEVFGPDGSILKSLKKSSPPLEKDRLNDIEYLCDRIRQYPEATLMNDQVKYRIVMLRQKAFKDKGSAASHKKVCKAIAGDGRQRKDKERLEDLRIMINEDIAFFKKILEMTESKKMNVEEAIENFLTCDATKRYEYADKRRSEASNYENVFYAYKSVYGELKKLMTKKEIFCFFEKAAEFIAFPNASIYVYPENRPLTFVKMKTWYLWGSDMKIVSQ